MLKKRSLLLLLGATLISGLGMSGCIVPTPTVAHGQDVADVNVFYNSLAPYGSWTVIEGYGRVWRPRHVRAGWRPYSDGRWVYSDAGWLWVAEEEWGWAPYHYGRWGHVPAHGWFWVPDVVWAPAWVSWRHSPGWIGWAPLPPAVTFNINIGLGPSHIDIVPSSFCFVREHHIVAPRVVQHIAPVTQNVTLVNVTKNVTNYKVVNNRVVNNSIDVERVEAETKQRIPRMRIVEDDDDKPGRKARVRENEGEVVVSRPVKGQLTATPQDTPGKPAASSAVVTPPDKSTPRRQGREDTERPASKDDTPPATEPRRQQFKTERQQMRERLGEERATMQERQRQEMQQAPAGTSAQELQERHKAERQAWREQARQQRQTLQQQQLEERPQNVPPQSGQPTTIAPSSPGTAGKPFVPGQQPPNLPPGPGQPPVQESGQPPDGRRKRVLPQEQQGSASPVQPGMLTPEERRERREQRRARQQEQIETENSQRMGTFR